MAQRGEDLKQIRIDNDNYQSTVYTLLALAACIVHDGKQLRQGSHFGFGRVMKTSKNNRQSPSSNVTPDAVIQMRVAYGMVAEVKRGLDKDVEHWDSHLAQLTKYDDDLQGWWTEDEKMASADVSVLIHHSRSRAFVQHIEKRAKDKSFLPSSRVSVIEFSKSDEADTFIFLRREWGKNNDPEIHAKLDVGVQIPLGNILMTFPNLKFYDHEAPLNYMLALLWTDLFPAMRDKGEVDEETGETIITVVVDEITTELQRAYGSLSLEKDARSAEFPQRSWVRRALDALADGGLADRTDDPNEFKIRFRPFRKDVQEQLYTLTEGKKGKKGKTVPEQIELLPIPPNKSKGRE